MWSKTGSGSHHCYKTRLLKAFTKVPENMSRGLLAAGLGLALTALLNATAFADDYTPTHGSGEMSMSADGSNIAFTVTGLQASDFVLLDIPTQRAFVVRGPLPHIGDLAWSPDGDELTFVTSNSHTLGGEGRHVWRLRLNGSTPTIELLALIPFVRSPVLSADGQHLATYEGVFVGAGQPASFNRAYAIFERSFSDGSATQRSVGYARLGGTLGYDREGALFVRVNSAVFPTRGPTGLIGWASHDDTGREEHQWLADIHAIFSFRILPNDTLPAWPTPFPVERISSGASLVRSLDDGRVVLYSTSNPYSSADWYDNRGRPRTPARHAQYDLVAYAGNGSGEVLVADPLPEGAGRSGGQDISSDGRYFAQVISRRPGQDDHIMMWYENGVLRSETRVADIVSRASRLSIEPSDVPIIPTSAEVHRIPAPE